MHVSQLRQERLWITGPGHGAAGIDHYHGPKIGFLLKLLDVKAILTAEQLPIDIAQLIARLVHAMLGELYRKPSAGRAMQTGQKALNHPFGQQFQAGEP